MQAQNKIIAQQQQENQALRTVLLRQQFEQAQSNHLLRQQAFHQARSLIEKAQQCQAAAYAGPIPILRVENASTVDSTEKDIAAETLCQLKGKK